MKSNTKLVSFDFQNSDKKYDDLFNYLKVFSNSRKISDSLWLIDTDLSVETLRNSISKYLDSDVLFFVLSQGEDSEYAWNKTIDDDISESWVRTKN